MDNLGKDESKEKEPAKNLKPLGEVKSLKSTTPVTPLVEDTTSEMTLEQKLDLLLKQREEDAKEREKERAQVEEMKKKLEAYEKDKGNTAKEIVAAIREANAGTQISATDKKTVFDEDDWIEAGVSFFSYRMATVMASDRRKGQESFPPNGPIFFGYSSTLARKEGSETHLVNICTYMSHSKKEVAWIEDHTEFKAGVVARRFNKDISYNQVQRSLRIAKHVNHIAKLGTNAVVMRCQEHRLPLLEDVEAMRVQLAEKMVADEMAAETQRSEQLLRESSREVLLEKASELA